MAAPKTDTTGNLTGAPTPNVLDQDQDQAFDPREGTGAAAGVKARRRRRGEGAGRVKRKLYVVINPRAVQETGEVSVVMHTHKAEEVLAHIDANKDHKYATIMV